MANSNNENLENTKCNGHVETHPFPPFVPSNAEILILGSFPGKEQTQSNNLSNQWFYGAPRNQFWKIIETVYDKKLNTQEEKQKLFSSLKIGITDIVLKARRANGSNLDKNLKDVEWNTEDIEKILRQHPNIKVLCTSKTYVEKHFKKLFPDFRKVSNLPSPSPRYARLTLEKKVAEYKNLLPKL